MLPDIHLKALEILNILVNSVHERDQKNTNPLFFTSKEVALTEEWIAEFIRHIQKEGPN
jgi:hypothetical protein